MLKRRLCEVEIFAPFAIDELKLLMFRRPEHQMVSEEIRSKSHITDVYDVPLADIRDLEASQDGIVIFEQTFKYVDLFMSF